MSEPIYDDLARAAALRDGLRLAQRAQRHLAALSGYDYASDLKEPDMSVLDTLRADFDKVLGDHSHEIEDGLDVAAKVAGNPLAQTVLGLAHVPPSILADISTHLQDLDIEFGRLKPPAEPAAGGEQPQPGIAV